MSAVAVKNLSKKFSRQLALSNVSFEIPERCVYGLLGPNGAGKTTLFSVAAGFLKPTSGSIDVLGIDVKNISRLRGRLSMLPQDASFQAGIPVIEQLVMFCRLNGLSKTAAYDASKDALELVGLGDVASKAARALSHGMAKRVALCQAFLGNPEVIFLDEPTAGLDPDNARTVRELIKSLVKDRTVVLSSHNLQEIQNICDYAAILHNGELAEAGSMEQLTGASRIIRIDLNAPLQPDVEQTLLRLPVVTNVERAEDNTFNLHIDVRGTQTHEDVMKAVYQTLAESDVFPKSVQEGASLEARFLEITGGTYDGGSGS